MYMQFLERELYMIFYYLLIVIIKYSTVNFLLFLSLIVCITADAWSKIIHVQKVCIYMKRD